MDWMKFKHNIYLVVDLLCYLHAKTGTNAPFLLFGNLFMGLESDQLPLLGSDLFWFNRN